MSNLERGQQNERAIRRTGRRGQGNTTGRSCTRRNRLHSKARFFISNKSATLQCRSRIGYSPPPAVCLLADQISPSPSTSAQVSVQRLLSESKRVGGPDIIFMRNFGVTPSLRLTFVTFECKLGSRCRDMLCYHHDRPRVRPPKSLKVVDGGWPSLTQPGGTFYRQLLESSTASSGRSFPRTSTRKVRGNSLC